jgi:hypothetical protein
MKNLAKPSFSEDTKTIENHQHKFVDIFCPLTKNELVTKNCTSCSHKQIIHAKHDSGRTLTTLICLYGLDEEGK